MRFFWPRREPPAQRTYIDLSGDYVLGLSDTELLAHGAQLLNNPGDYLLTSGNFIALETARRVLLKAVSREG